MALGVRPAVAAVVRDTRARRLELQPDCLVLDLNGLTVPWHCELLLSKARAVFCPPGNTHAAFQGQTISPSGWFWHPSTPWNLLTTDQIVDSNLEVLEPRYATFILNCPPNTDGLLDDSVVAVLKDVGSTGSRPVPPPLPAQPDVVRHLVTPVSATATSGNAAKAMKPGHSDYGSNSRRPDAVDVIGPAPAVGHHEPM